jgi:hypothetical protein
LRAFLIRLDSLSIPTSISRFSDYLKRNGLSATARRVALAVRRSLFANRSVLFYCDLPTLGPFPHALPDSLTIERVRSQAELSQADFEQITSFWNPELARRNIEERFGLGASIWMIRSNGNLAGYGWTLQGRTVEPHYFPLSANDVQFFDFHVFPKYRGRAMDWFVMTYALHQLAAEGCLRAYGEAAEWNKASISSFGTTPFRRFGMGKKYSLAGHTIVRWAPENRPNQKKPVSCRMQADESIPSPGTN